jgi:hypothetical protein
MLKWFEVMLRKMFWQVFADTSPGKAGHFFQARRTGPTVFFQTAYRPMIEDCRTVDVSVPISGDVCIVALERRASFWCSS